jgi:hypothetical protein
MVTSPSAEISPRRVFELLFELRARPVAARQRAGKRAADLDVAAADRLLPEHRIKRHQLVDVDRLQPELLRDPLDGRGRDVALLLLHQVQQRERRTPFDRIVRDDLARFPRVSRP